MNIEEVKYRNRNDQLRHQINIGIYNCFYYHLTDTTVCGPLVYVGITETSSRASVANIRFRLPQALHQSYTFYETL
jgi:hypothetical protein